MTKYPSSRKQNNGANDFVTLNDDSGKKGPPKLVN